MNNSSNGNLKRIFMITFLKINLKHNKSIICTLTKRSRIFGSFYLHNTAGT